MAMICMLLFLPYEFDNIIEVQSLIPNLSLEPVVRENMRTNLTRTAKETKLDVEVLF